MKMLERADACAGLRLSEPDQHRHFETLLDGLIDRCRLVPMECDAPLPPPPARPAAHLPAPASMAAETPKTV